MSIAAVPMAAQAIAEPGAEVAPVRRAPAKRQAIAVRDATLRPEPR